MSLNVFFLSLIPMFSSLTNYILPSSGKGNLYLIPSSYEIKTVVSGSFPIVWPLTDSASECFTAVSWPCETRHQVSSLCHSFSSPNYAQACSPMQVHVPIWNDVSLQETVIYHFHKFFTVTLGVNLESHGGQST